MQSSPSQTFEGGSWLRLGQSRALMATQCLFNKFACPNLESCVANKCLKTNGKNKWRQLIQPRYDSLYLLVAAYSKLTKTKKPKKQTKKNTRTMCKICSRLTIKTSERRHWRRSGVFIVTFEHISDLCLVL